MSAVRKPPGFSRDYKLNVAECARKGADAEQVLELALDSGDTRRTFEIGGEIHVIDMTDDGTRLIVAGRGEDKLALIDLADGAVKTTPLAPQPYHVTTIPGAGKILVSSRAEPNVWSSM